MTLCPICSAESKQKYKDSPYHICPNCQCWFQHPFPEKTFIAEFEGPPDQMSEGDRRVNVALAANIFRDVMHGNPGKTLDIGCKMPVLADAFRVLGCDAHACDPCIQDVPGLSQKENLQHHHTNFEDDDHFKYLASFKPFDLITLIHTFEHLYDPVAAIRKLRHLVAPTGHVFIRIPDHLVGGFERDLTPGHYSIHPFYHCITSLLELLVQTKDTFCISWSEAMEGAGQRDFVLSPVARRPTVCLGAIVRNEKRDLPKMLAAAAPAIDTHWIVDTGSNDGTEKLADETWLEASDEQGRLNHFSKARNRYLEKAQRLGDWVLTLDADDILETPNAVRRASYLTQFDAFAFYIRDGASDWLTHRMWKTDKGLVYDGRCHEYPTVGQVKNTVFTECRITHHGEPSTNQEDSNARNLRMLTLEWQERQSPRCAFYMANTHRDGGRWKEAAEWYGKRIAMGHAYYDEWIFAHLYCGRALLRLGQIDLAKEAFEAGLKGQPEWCEFKMELAFIEYNKGNWQQAIEMATPCLNAKIPPTNLWREPTMYQDQPARLISWCQEHLGNLGLALAWAEIASEKIGGPDAEWNNRTRSLRDRMIKTPAPAKHYGSSIALHRPGAIGDIIMTLNLIPEIRKMRPGCRIDYFCDPSIGRAEELGSLMYGAGIDSILPSSSWWQEWQKYELAISLVGYPLEEGYPDKPMKRHLIDYFAAEMGVSRGEPLHLSKPPNPFPSVGAYATLQTTAGWSKYKQWPIDRWKEVVKALPFPVIHLAPSGAKTIPDTIVASGSLRDCINVFANAKIHLGIDSFCNHLTNYYWNDRQVPGVILWGSTQASAAGYAHNRNISLGLHCQPCFRENPAISKMSRGPCINPFRPSYEDDTLHACMDIAPELVVEHAVGLWIRQNGNAPEGASST
jgi:ADP-heptose:LPS heptosyltransferase/SAM-dependent methyltransferase